jgi:hypothetical protein
MSAPRTGRPLIRWTHSHTTAIAWDGSGVCIQNAWNLLRLVGLYLAFAEGITPAFGNRPPRLPLRAACSGRRQAECLAAVQGAWGELSGPRGRWRTATKSHCPRQRAPIGPIESRAGVLLRRPAPKLKSANRRARDGIVQCHIARAPGRVSGSLDMLPIRFSTSAFPSRISKAAGLLPAKLRSTWVCPTRSTNRRGMAGNCAFVP